MIYSTLSFHKLLKNKFLGIKFFLRGAEKNFIKFLSSNNHREKYFLTTSLLKIVELDTIFLKGESRRFTATGLKLKI